MKRFLIGLTALLFASGVAFAGEIDDGYLKAFGRGTILVAQKGFPAKKEFDPSQFDYKDGVFRIPAGDEAKLNVRAILPEGMTLGSELKKLKKEKGENLKFHTGDYCVFKVWRSHDFDTNLVTADRPWPKKLGDEPLWESPKEGFTTLSEEVYDWWAPGAKYEGDFAVPFFGWLNNCKAGTKLYITFSVCYEYKTPAGEIENKWNPDKQKWEPVVSSGLLGYVYSDPLCHVTVELK